jgi:iron-sulfur cluster assembly accessory protein
MANVVTLTDPAIAHFASIAATKTIIFSIIKGSCAGYKYSWAIHDTLDCSGDITKYPNFNFVVRDDSILHLLGSTIDYDIQPLSSKIVITNPNASATCGCGDSIKIDTHKI